jgi:hypothetical protein
MPEIDKLKQRLKNVNQYVIEYRMTIAEARNLVKEFDDLQNQLREALEKPPQVVVKEAPVVTKTTILDGGTF